MITPIEIAARAAIWAATPTPSPVPAYQGDPNLITPGVIGFGVTFLVALITVFLLLDMTRRMRRLRYRAEIREKLAQEQMAAEIAEMVDGRDDPDKIDGIDDTAGPKP